ncbi:hypothetical protein BJ742DRAFT_743981 [Cladochytrium replicatum]|nr:hypothetical protein BJ742DRAFT_743981 [Cladochytrium replicatum]
MLDFLLFLGVFALLLDEFASIFLETLGEELGSIKSLFNMLDKSDGYGRREQTNGSLLDSMSSSSSESKKISWDGAPRLPAIFWTSWCIRRDRIFLKSSFVKI